MPNEEIISALRNAIDHGDSLDSAVKIMIDSGYNPEEVYEASTFIGGKSIQEISPEEHLIMPEEKSNLSSKFNLLGKPPQQVQQTIQQPQQPIQQPRRYPTQQLPQYPQQTTQEQIKQSFQHPIQQYPSPFQQSQPLQQPRHYPIQQPQPVQQTQYPQQIIRPPRPIPQLTPRQGELSREIQKIKPARQGYTKEIILLMILLILIGVLVSTIIFKDTILGWFA